MDIELAELAEAEAAINDAEEEELWHLTLVAQLKHLQVRVNMYMALGPA